MKRVWHELWPIAAFACGLGALFAVISCVAAIFGTDGFALFWRMNAIAGALLLLVAAVLLLTNRRDSKKMKLWQQRFPHIPFTWAVILAGAVLLCLAGIVNYLTF